MNEEWREQEPADGAASKDRAAGTGGGDAGARGPWSTLVSLGCVVAAVIAGLLFARDAVTDAALFLVILLGLVMVHEAAHFFTAKGFGITVHEFAFGFPPRIAAKRFGETEYSINWLPLGGYVRLEGEESPTGPRAFASQPAWQRLIVLSSGALVNLALPIVLFSVALMVPHDVQEGRAVISDVIEGTPAAEAGLRSGDVILALGGREAANLIEASRYVRLNQGKTVEFTVRREGQVVRVPVYSRWGPPEGQGPTGISIAPQAVGPDGRPYTISEAMPPWEAIPQATRQSWDTLILARNEVFGWFKGGAGPQLAGPVGIARTTGEVARASDTTTGAISPLLELAALLSLNLGVLNLLPLPMLDGGRVLFLAIEVVRGKRVAPEREAVVHLVGFIAFMALAIVITFSDIRGIINGDSMIR